MCRGSVPRAGEMEEEKNKMGRTDMLKTFFCSPFWRSGRKALVTLCASVTLVLKVEFKSVLLYHSEVRD